jgi:hypothetical protein
MEEALFLMGGRGAPTHLRKINAGHIHTHSLLIKKKLQLKDFNF